MSVALGGGVGERSVLGGEVRMAKRSNRGSRRAMVHATWSQTAQHWGMAPMLSARYRPLPAPPGHLTPDRYRITRPASLFDAHDPRDPEEAEYAQAAGARSAPSSGAKAVPVARVAVW
jgi:hypothetical protein